MASKNDDNDLMEDKKEDRILDCAIVNWRKTRKELLESRRTGKSR